MDREQLTEHLAMTERHVAQGLGHLSSQRRIIANLEREGHDATTAIDLLALFEKTQASHVADRDRIRAELRNLDLRQRR